MSRENNSEMLCYLFQSFSLDSEIKILLKMVTTELIYLIKHYKKNLL